MPKHKPTNCCDKVPYWDCTKVGPQGPAGRPGNNGQRGATGPHGGEPVGDDTDVQFNNAGEFGGSNDFQWDNAAKSLRIGGTINLRGSTSNDVLTLSADENTNPYTLEFPPIAPLPNTVLTADGLGKSEWQPKTQPGGADTQVQYNDGGVFGGDSDFTWDNGTNTLTIDTTPGTVIAGAVVGGINLVGGSIGIGGGGGKLELIGSTSGDSVALAAAATTGTYILTLPTTQGGVGTLLLNDGSGNLTWTPAAAPGVSWEYIIHSDSNTTGDQSLTYCYSTLPAGVDQDVVWLNDATAIVDNTYFTFSGTDMTCTTSIPAHLNLKIQTYMTGAINAGSSPTIKLTTRLNGNNVALDGLRWSGADAGTFVSLQNISTVPNVVAGDIITIHMFCDFATIATNHMNYKCWLEP